MEKEKIFYLFKKSFNEFQKDNALTSAAALAFYALISIFPFLVLILLIADFFLDAGVIIEQFRNFAFNFGGSGAASIADFLANAVQSRQKGTISIISLFAILIGGTALFVHLQDTINAMWGVEKKKRKATERIIRKRITSFLLVIIFVLVLISSVIVMAIIADINRTSLFYFSSPWSLFLLNLANYVVTLVLVTLFFALLFKILPDRKISYKDVSFGAFITAVLFLMSQILVGLYFNYTEFSTGFGAAGSVILLLVWIYYSAIVFLFGTEFTYIYSTEYRDKKRRIKT